MVLYNGTNANNSYSATSTGMDKIYGFGGDDILVLTGANNPLGYLARSFIYGGDGNDQITVNNSLGVNVFGEAGNNTIIANNSSQIYVSAGSAANAVSFNNVNKSDIVLGVLNDKATISGHSLDAPTVGGSNSISGNSGNDTITVTTQGNTLYGDAGDDTIYLNLSLTKALPTVGSKVDFSVNHVDGGAGNDVITSTLPVGLYLGGAGNDAITIDNSNALYKNYQFTAKQINAGTTNTINKWNTVVNGGSGEDTLTLVNVNKAIVSDGSSDPNSLRPTVGFFLDHARDTIRVVGNDNTILLTDGDVLTATGINNDVRLYFAENVGTAGSITSNNAASANLNYKGANELYLMGKTGMEVANDYKSYVMLRQGNDLLVGLETSNLYDTVIKNQFSNFSGFEAIKANVNAVVDGNFLPTDWTATLSATSLTTLTNNLTNTFHFTSLDAVRASAQANTMIDNAWQIG
jgi:RTX calcium-binding nonapeptide repeat (4 copies)